MVIALDGLMADRSQMAPSPGFHLALACFGVVLPVSIWRYVLVDSDRRSNDEPATATAV